jgi:hypothetical protein
VHLERCVLDEEAPRSTQLAAARTPDEGSSSGGGGGGGVGTAIAQAVRGLRAASPAASRVLAGLRSRSGGSGSGGSAGGSDGYPHHRHRHYGHDEGAAGGWVSLEIEFRPSTEQGALARPSADDSSDGAFSI